MPPARNDPETIREEAVNVPLAQMLGGYGASARAERRSRKGTPDVRVELRTGDSVLLECKWEGAASSLDDQLDERLDAFPDALGLIGVLYPERLRHLANVEDALEVADDIRWWLHGSRGQKMPDHRVRTGTVAELADHLRALPLELEGADRVVAATGVVGYAIEQAANQVARHARTSRRITDVIASTDREKDRAAARRIGCLVLFNAIAFQDRLAVANGDVPTVRESLRTGARGLRDTWLTICDEIDYVPVFELAASILDILIDAPEDSHSPVIDPLVRAMENTRRLEGHDLSGRLFHTLLTDAKFTGAYYTSVPAATLLSRLVFHNWPSHVDWSDYEFPASLNVADLACGTGTLLMAVADEAGRRHEAAGGQNAAELHKSMVEQALYGYDVQLSAVHFAATSLAMLNPHIEFDRMNLYVMPLGAEGSRVWLGSLDFLGQDEVAVQFALSSDDEGATGMSATRVSGRGARSVTEGVTATLPELDLAIMNPPFTRSVGGNLLFGSLPTAERRRLQKELSDRLKSRQASATAGLGAAFVAAASPKLRPGEGRLALVLPATVCTGPSWAQTRALIERDFDLDVVITSHDPLRWNFSDSTDLSEALLIATRRAEGETSELSPHQVRQPVAEPGRRAGRSPDRPGYHDYHTSEARRVGYFAAGGGRRSRRGSGRDADGVDCWRKKWSGVQFARADLIRSALRLLKDGEVWIPGETALRRKVSLCRLDALGQVGPDRRRLVDGFDRTSSVTSYPLVEGHDTEQRKSMTCSPDSYLSPLTVPKGGQKPGYGERLWQQAAGLLVAERLRLDTARVTAMLANVKVLSNVWWPVRVEDESVEKALALWLNSTLGLLTFMAERTSTEGSWVAMKKADLEELPVLDTRRLSASQLQRLSNLFDEMAEAEFERLPGMVECPARRRLDDGVSEILGLPDLGNLRRLLASEPVVSNERL